MMTMMIGDMFQFVSEYCYYRASDGVFVGTISSDKICLFLKIVNDTIQMQKLYFMAPSGNVYHTFLYFPLHSRNTCCKKYQ